MRCSLPKMMLGVIVLAILLAYVVESAKSAEVENTRGVIALERVVELPDDSEKWYLSIVGVDGEARYENILGCFGPNGNDGLGTLRKQVHFREIDSDTVIYKARYATNVKGLPTVRLQKHNGEVVYESAGDNLPLSAEGLYGALANASSKAQGLGIFRPWGRSLNRTPKRSPCPDGKCPVRPPVVPAPVDEDPAPAPLDPGGPPEMAAQTGLDMASAGIGAGSVLLCLFGGGGASLFVQWRRMYRQ